MKTWHDWHEVDIKNWKLLPNHADLIGKEYTSRGRTIRVVDVCCIFAATNVEVMDICEPSKPWSCPAAEVRAILKGE